MPNFFCTVRPCFFVCFGGVHGFGLHMGRCDHLLSRSQFNRTYFTFGICQHYGSVHMLTDIWTLRGCVVVRSCGLFRAGLHVSHALMICYVSLISFCGFCFLVVCNVLAHILILGQYYVCSFCVLGTFDAYMGQCNYPQSGKSFSFFS